MAALGWLFTAGGLLLVWCGWTSRNPVQAVADVLTDRPLSERQSGRQRSSATAPASSTAARAVVGAGGGTGAQVAAQTAYDAGFRGNALVVAVAIAGAESGWRADASNSTGNEPAGSVDRGMWQLNSHWHSEVSDECAYAPRCAAKAVYRISAAGLDWSQWVTYTSGAYSSHLPAAQAAVHAVTA